VREKTPDLILIVEDDDALRTAIRMNLVKRGRVVREVATLRDALMALDDVLPALILLDLNLPDGPGKNLLAELRSRGILIPTVVMSAAGISSLRLAESQPVWYLAKPFRIEALLDVIALAEAHRPELASLDGAPLDLPGWARELRSACITLSRASTRAIRTMSLSLRVAAESVELSPQSFATRLAGEYGLTARSELVDGWLRVWLRREEGDLATEPPIRELGSGIELSDHEAEAGATGGGSR
jgi:DNA-binding response OmpR family regulator